MRLAVLAILLATIALPGAVASHVNGTNDPGQTWTLGGAGQMTRTGAPSGDFTDVILPTYWCADEPAALAYDMRGLVFNITVQVLQADDLAFAVGKCSELGEFELCRTWGSESSVATNPTLEPALASHDLEHNRAVMVSREIAVSTSQVGACVVDVGERLAVRVTPVNGPARIGHHVIPASPLDLRSARPASTFSSDHTLPAYPTPELTTIALTGIGLVGVMLFVRRRS